MLRSMTAYGRVKKSFSDFEITVEIHSVNKKHLDIHLRMPQEFLPLECEVRKLLSDSIPRGNVTVHIRVDFLHNPIMHVKLNKALAHELQSSIRDLAHEIGYENISSQEILGHILREKNIMQFVGDDLDHSLYQEPIHEVVRLALDELFKMKDFEGVLLQEEFESRLRILEGLIEQIRGKSEFATHKYRIKITELLGTLLPNAQDNDERIIREIALMAEKVDITEEVARFGFHLDSFQKTLQDPAPKGSSGKVLEFILQEMHREINTIGNKSQDAALISLVIQAKSEIEKMREQIQNVE